MRVEKIINVKAERLGQEYDFDVRTPSHMTIPSQTILDEKSYKVQNFSDSLAIHSRDM